MYEMGLKLVIGENKFPKTDVMYCLYKREGPLVPPGRRNVESV